MDTNHNEVHKSEVDSHPWEPATEIYIDLYMKPGGISMVVVEVLVSKGHGGKF